MSTPLTSGFVESFDPKDTLVLLRHVISVHICKGAGAPGWSILVTTVQGQTHRVTETGYRQREVAQEWALELVAAIESYAAQVAGRQSFQWAEPPLASVHTVRGNAQTKRMPPWNANTSLNRFKSGEEVVVAPSR